MVGEGKPFDWNDAANSMSRVPRWFKNSIVLACWCLFVAGGCFGAIVGHLVWK